MSSHPEQMKFLSAAESPLKEIPSRSKLFCIDLGRLFSKCLSLSLDYGSFPQCFIAVPPVLFIGIYHPKMMNMQLRL